jgi:hypothetical protein
MSSATDVSLRFPFVDAGSKDTHDCSLVSGCARIASEGFLVAVDRSRVAWSLCSGRVFLNVSECRDISLARPKMKPAPSARAPLATVLLQLCFNLICVRDGWLCRAEFAGGVAEARVLVRLASLVATEMLPLPYSRH